MEIEKKQSVKVYSLTIESLCGLEQVKHLPGSHFLSCEVKELVEQLIECLSGYPIDDSLNAVALRNVPSLPLSISIFVNDSESASLEHEDESFSSANIFTKKRSWKNNAQSCGYLFLPAASGFPLMTQIWFCVNNHLLVPRGCLQFHQHFLKIGMILKNSILWFEPGQLFSSVAFEVQHVQMYEFILWYIPYLDSISFNKENQCNF